MPAIQTQAPLESASSKEGILPLSWQQELIAMRPVLDALVDVLLNDDELKLLFIKQGAVPSKPVGDNSPEDPIFVDSCTLSVVNLTPAQLDAALKNAEVEAWGVGCSRITINPPLL